MVSTYFQQCIFVFYLLGQNSYNLRANRFRVWLKHIPRILCLFLSCAGIACHLAIEWSLQRPIALVNIIKLTVAFLISTLVVFEYFMTPNGVRKLNFAYKDLIDYLERKLYVKIYYDRFKRTFQGELLMVLSVFLFVFITKAIFLSYGDMDAAELAQFFIYYLKQFPLLHILFHFEFVHFSMQTINTELNPMNEQYEYVINPVQPKTVELLLLLRHWKHIHFRVWEIFRILNLRFGWILMALMLATLLDVTYSSYWMWVYIHKSCHEHITLHRMMRKYTFGLFLIYFLYFGDFSRLHSLILIVQYFPIDIPRISIVHSVLSFGRPF